MPGRIVRGVADTVELSDMQVFAIYLHDKFCSGNHIDGCSWYYEVKRVPVMGGYAYDEPHAEWDQYAHKIWMDKAKEIRSFNRIQYLNSLARSGA